jgi:hypothetical protein
MKRAVVAYRKRIGSVVEPLPSLVYYISESAARKWLQKRGDGFSANGLRRIAIVKVASGEITLAI